MYVEPRGRLTLRDAWASALMRNPELASVAWETRIAEAIELQAGLSPNPEAGIAIENVGGTHDFGGVEAAETTIGISQLFELGGKRAKRTRVAQFETELAGWDYEARRLALLTEVTKQYVDVVAAQRRLELAHEDADLATQVLMAVEKRARAGAIPPIEVDKQSVEVVTTRVALERARHELSSARARLAATWGSTAAQFDIADGGLSDIGPVPPLEAITSLVSQNPDVARWATVFEHRRAAFELANAQRVPDLTAGAGVRHFSETDDTALVFELSLPIPISDQNQGEILAARLKVAKTAADQHAAEVQVATSLSTAYHELSAAYSEAIALRDDALPAAQRAFDAAQKAFERGQVDYLAVLDAQRTLIEARSGYVSALAAYHVAAAGIEGLIGRSLTELGTTPSSGPQEGDSSDVSPRH